MMEPEPGSPKPRPPSPEEAAPQLTDEQRARLASYGSGQDVRRGDVVFRPGEPAYDLIVVEAGTVELVAPSGPGDDEAVIATYGRGGFIGELNLLTGQTVHLAARVVEPGRIYRIPRPSSGASWPTRRISPTCCCALSSLDETGSEPVWWRAGWRSSASALPRRGSPCAPMPHVSAYRTSGSRQAAPPVNGF